MSSRIRYFQFFIYYYLSVSFVFPLIDLRFVFAKFRSGSRKHFPRKLLDPFKDGKTVVTARTEEKAEERRKMSRMLGGKGYKMVLSALYSRLYPGL